MKTQLLILLLFVSTALMAQNYPIVGTNQSKAYNNSNEITIPSSGEAFYGQNANYPGLAPSYTDHGDGTISDNITGLMWQKSPDLNQDGQINSADKLTLQNAIAAAAQQNTGGYHDWRLPTIKELYSLILFSGYDVSSPNPSILIPFIDTNFFDFAYGDLTAGERLIDAQYLSSTEYVSTTMMNSPTVFGVNFADGRIKGYGYVMPGGLQMDFYVQYVRGNPQYGINQFVDLADGTIYDAATGLTWMKDDNAAAVLWEDALQYAENFSYAGFSDWRVPTTKELQSIVDYTRSPSTSNSPAIDPIFNSSSILDEGNQLNYPSYWTSTTHQSEGPLSGTSACYVSFGTALGYLETPPASGVYTLTDVHGAGAQRSDFKTGDPLDYPYGHGPQGDVVRIRNYVRLVRGESSIGITKKEDFQFKVYPQPASDQLYIQFGKADLTEIAIFSITGQRLIYLKNSEPSIELNVSEIPSGLYLLTIRAGNKTNHQNISIVR